MNRAIKGKLTALPYREMLELSREISTELGIGNAPKVAECLTGLAKQDDTEFATKERDMLHSMFTRKKSITVQRHENGFKISIGAQGVDIYSDDIRDGISQALDNLVAIKALS